MKKSEELFFLVKSMSPSEKGYFSSRAQDFELNGNKNGYALLFKDIAKQTVYDEKVLIKKHTKSGKQSEFSTKKNQLFSKILEVMRIYHKENKLAQKADELLREAKFLLNRGIISTAISKLEKITNNPDEYEHRVVMDACHLSRYLIVKYEGKTRIEKLRDIRNLEQTLLKNETLLNKLLCLYDEAFLCLQNESLDEELSRIEQLSLLNAKFNEIKEVECTTYQTQKYFYTIEGNLGLLNSEVGKSFVAYQKLLNLYETNPKWREEDRLHYIGSIYNYALVCFSLERYSLVLEKIEMLRVMKGSSSLFQSKIFYTGINIELSYLLNTYQFDKGLELIPYIEKQIKKYGNLIAPEYIRTIYYNLVSLLLLAEDFNEILPWTEKIEEIKNTSSEYYKILDAIHLFRIITYIELEVNNLDNQIKRTRYYYSTKRRDRTLVDKLVEVATKLEAAMSKKEKIAIYTAAYTDIKNTCTEFMGCEEVLMWLKSRITGKSIEEIAQEKQDFVEF